MALWADRSPHNPPETLPAHGITLILLAVPAAAEDARPESALSRRVGRRWRRNLIDRAACAGRAGHIDGAGRTGLPGRSGRAAGANRSRSWRVSVVLDPRQR